MTYGARLGLAATGIVGLAGVVAALLWLSGRGPPPNAGRCKGPDPFVAHWRQQTAGLEYADSDGKSRGVHPLIVSTPDRCIEAHCRDGTWDGPWVRWHRDGTRAEEGAYRNGLRVGEWRRWAPDGGLLGKMTFTDGNGRWTDWHDNGTKAEEGDYVEGERTGSWRAWSADGELSAEVGFAHSLKDGEARWYLPDGGVWKSTLYFYGQPVDAGTPRPKNVPRIIPSGEVTGCGP